ncbi:L,D-transpeptidase family protein [Thalassospira sp.]|uniref:L,D-transpeptidase family protein n=1 Tax=Thalassospira sp. TaxID=1912094 RepID=UPI001B2D3A6A|nr:L,D-transpeptidase family protein [Thalassospira sp.]MBO6806538.1 L,D-transpeptidase family protein [Thalassospira sp.]MBO6838941.1 L,D-transpeptidase family protein [Thalassospira sp.]
MQSDAVAQSSSQTLELSASADGFLRVGDHSFRCALGFNGVIDADSKTEGDGKTPAGRWQLRYVMYRADRRPCPRTRLPVTTISFWDGWCDDPKHPDYNCPVRLPFDASHEKLFRDDDLYNIIVVLGHNDDPPVPGKGSAIFMHIAKPDYAGTEGCVALAEDELETLLGLAAFETFITITA